MGILFEVWLWAYDKIKILFSHLHVLSSFLFYTTDVGLIFSYCQFKYLGNLSSMHRSKRFVTDLMHHAHAESPLMGSEVNVYFLLPL